MINIEIKNSNKCNGDYSLFVSFNYNTDILDIVKQFPTRVYNKDDKTWEIPFNQLGNLVNKLSAYDITISGKYIKLDTAEIEIPKSFEFKTKPYAHQIEGLKYGLNHNKWLLGDEQGLGKTKQVIDIAVAKNVKHCLIVCCVNGLKWNWRNEVHTHSNDNAWILGQQIKNDNITIGGNPDRLADLNNIDKLPRFIITNIETLRYKVKTGKKIMKKVNGRLKEVDEYVYPITEKLQELCASGEIEMIAVDEFHKCKNPEADQAQQILKVKTPIQIAMTGTPLMNAPLDLFMPLKWLDYEKHSFYQFKTHHCNLGGYGGYEVVGYKNLEEIEETLDTMMLRRLKEDVLDLPEKIQTNVYLDMSNEQAKVYDAVHSDIVSNMSNLKMANNPLTELIRLRQATGNPEILNADVKDNVKFEQLLEDVEDAVANSRKTIIFSNWVQIVNPAYALLSKRYKGKIITGETKDNERQENVDAFQTDENVKFIIGTIGAMGTGLTLTAGTLVIFLDEPWNKALKDQAEDRGHRIGQKHTLNVRTYICKGTIDEKINNLVEKKGVMADILVDGKIEGDKNALINYLLS